MEKLFEDKQVGIDSPSEVAAKGGKARAKKLTPERRKEIAQKANKKRWENAKKKKESAGLLPVAKYKGFLNIMEMDIPCYVLDNGQRVIGRVAATEVLTGIKGGGSFEKTIAVQSLKPFINVDLVLERLIEFRLPEVEGTGNQVKGLPADLYIEVCRGFVSALDLNSRTDIQLDFPTMTDRQKEMAIKASLFLSGCAKVGLDALIDEATGYQYDRAEDALQVKLRAYLEEEMRPWERTFPDELWVQLVD